MKVTQTVSRDQLVTRLLKKVKAKISGNPKCHKQDCWIKLKNNQFADSLNELQEIEKKYNCKTPCCFAGHIVYEANFNYKQLLKDIDDNNSIEETAKEIIGKFSNHFWSYITSGDFGKKLGKTKQTELYIKLLDLIIQGRSERYIAAYLLEFFNKQMEQCQISNLQNSLL